MYGGELLEHSGEAVEYFYKTWKHKAHMVLNLPYESDSFLPLF